MPSPRSTFFPGAITLFVAALLLKTLPLAASPADGIDPASCRVEPRSGTSLCWNTDEAIFPLAKTYAMSATPLPIEERERSLKVVEAALARYPAPLLHENLKAVFLVESLHFKGVSASGTYSRDCVYLADRGVKKGFTDRWIAEVFHAEFSSVLLWRHKSLFDAEAWNACNAPGFKYVDDGVGAIKNGTASTEPQPEWWGKGFLNQYSTASTEEDFNALVDYLFSHAPNDRPALAASPALRLKVLLVESFYRKLGMDINSPDETITLSQ